MPAPLRPEVRERLRAIVIERVLPRFGDEPERQQSAAARALKVHPSSINRLVNEGTGGSVDLIEKVERLLNEPPGFILGYASTGADQVPKFRDLPGFNEVLDEAERRAKESKILLTRQEFKAAGDFRLSPPPSRLTPDLLVQIALALSGDDAPPQTRPRRKK